MKREKLLSLVRQCVNAYGLIEPGDRIAVGLSGGKDSLTLLYALAALRDILHGSFELAAVHIDPGFHSDLSALRAFSESLSVPFHSVRTEIYQIVFLERKEENPCALCSHLRRGALLNAASDLGCNKLALGHNRDDYLTTLLLSLFYEGRIYTFAPRTDFPDRGIAMIRPLLYVPEAACASFSGEQGFPVLKNPCPADKNTRRAEMGALLSELNRRYPGLRDRLLHAVETSDIPDWKAQKPKNGRTDG